MSGTPVLDPIPVARFGRLRRAAAWTAAGLLTLLTAGILLLTNLLSEKIHRRIDCTRSDRFRIQEYTANLLAGLDRDVTVYVMPMPESPYGGESPLPRVRQHLEDLLGEFAQRSPRLHARWVTEQDAESYAVLSKAFEGVQYYSLYVLSGSGEGGKRQEILLPELVDSGGGGANVLNFRAEEALVNAILQVTAKESAILYHTTGHGELDPAVEDQPIGMGIAMQQFKRRDGVDLRPLPLAEAVGVPSDARALLIAGPLQPFTEAETAKVRDYLERGGRVFFAPVPEVKSGLDGLLASWGVSLGKHPVLEEGGSHLEEVFVREFPPHEINQGMQGRPFRTQVTVIVEPTENVPEGIRVLPLMVTGPQAWEELQPYDPERPRVWDRNERGGGLCVGLSAEAVVEAPDRKSGRLVVWGSVFALANSNLFSLKGGIVESQVSYVLNTFRWLLGRQESIRIGTVRQEVEPYAPSEGARRFLWWVIQVGFPSMSLFVGLFVWFLRRR